ncbi:MAG: hypothetical protein SPJ13_00540 [Bacteroidales bacterium]|nr:hypothetical protein [Bacteroidales bacterium]
MKIHLSKVSAVVACLLFAGALSLVSCGGNQVSQQEIDSLQKQLDSIMVQYERVKAEAGEQVNNGQLAQKDSTIEAQAKEIQGLLNRLKQAQRAKLGAEASSESGATLRNQQKMLRQKEAEINSLQKKLNEQQNQLAELRRNGGKGENVNGDVAALQKQVREQQNQINDLTSQLENSGKSMDVMRQQRDHDAERMGEQITSLQRQVNDLQNQLEEARGMLKNASQTSNNSAEVSRLKGQVEDLNAQVVALNKKLAEAEKTAQHQESDLQNGVNKENAALKTQLDAVRKELENCQLQQQQLSNQVSALQNEVKNGSNLQNTAAASAKEIASLQKTVAEQQSQIADLQAQIKAQEAELTKAAKESKNASKGAVSAKLEALQTLCDSYVEQIAALKAENEQLKAENATLKETNLQAQQVIAENAELVKKVEMASVLVTSEVTAQGGKSISGTVLKETTKAKYVKVVRINAHLVANNVITPGSVTIYARIATAANRVVCNGNPSDFSFDMDGVPMQYTMSQDIEFTGAARNISMVWRKFESVVLEPGLYWVTLYANGYEIGKTSFKLE